MLSMDKLQPKGQNLGWVFNFKVAICMLHNFVVISKTAKLKVKNLAQTTSRFSPVSYHIPCAVILHAVIWYAVFDTLSFDTLAFDMQVFDILLFDIIIWLIVIRVTHILPPFLLTNDSSPYSSASFLGLLTPFFTIPLSGRLSSTWWRNCSFNWSQNSKGLALSLFTPTSTG